MKISLYGRYNPMFPSLVDYSRFYYLFSGLFAYIILHKYLKFSLLNSFIIFNLIHLIYECKDYYYTYLKKSYKKMLFFGFFIFLHNTHLLYFSRTTPSPRYPRHSAQLPSRSTPHAPHH